MRTEDLYPVIGRVNKKGVALTPETRFIDDLGLDSLTVMELVAQVEDEFDVNLPLNLLPDIHTVADLAACIDELKKGAE